MQPVDPDFNPPRGPRHDDPYFNPSRGPRHDDSYFNPPRGPRHGGPYFNLPRGPRHGVRRGQYEQVWTPRRGTRPTGHDIPLSSPRDVAPDEQSQSLSRQAAEAAPNLEPAEDEGLSNGTEPDADSPFDYRNYIGGLPKEPQAAPSVSATSPPRTTTTIQHPSAVTTAPTRRSSRLDEPLHEEGGGQYKWFVWSLGRGNQWSGPHVPVPPVGDVAHQRSNRRNVGHGLDMHGSAGRLTGVKLLDRKRQDLSIRKDRKTRIPAQVSRVNEKLGESIAAAVRTSKLMTVQSTAEADMSSPH